MNIRNISIRSGFFLLVTGSVLFWLLAGSLVFSLINNPISYQDASSKRASENSEILKASHNSSLVAEYNILEELISIKDKFQSHLEVQTSLLLGKKQYDIDRLNWQMKYRENK